MKRNQLKHHLTGKVFGKLTVIGGYKREGGYIHWLCRCSCGVEKYVLCGNLLRRNSKSCGCDRINNRTKSHGMCSSRFYKIYYYINSRCNDVKCSNYHRYGGLGIKLLWKSFSDFKKDMYKSYLEHVDKFGEKETTIDRIDSTKGYYKENCRWATYKEQALNKDCVLSITWNGETHYLEDWSNITGIKKGTLMYRLKKGWDTEKILTTKVRTWS